MILIILNSISNRFGLKILGAVPTLGLTPRRVVSGVRAVRKPQGDRTFPLREVRVCQLTIREGYWFNWKKGAKDNFSFRWGGSELLCLATVVGQLSRKYLQATVQKPNLVCGQLILSHYIPSVDSFGAEVSLASGCTLLSPSFVFAPFVPAGSKLFDCCGVCVSGQIGIPLPTRLFLGIFVSVLYIWRENFGELLGGFDRLEELFSDWHTVGERVITNTFK